MEISSASQRILSSLLEARTGQQLSFSRRWRIDSADAARSIFGAGRARA